MNETWSQKDISENKLAFRLLRDTFSPAEDSVSFSVGAPQCQPIEEASLTLKYNPSEEQRNQVQVTLRPVQVSVRGYPRTLLEFEFYAYRIFYRPPAYLRFLKVDSNLCLSNI